MIPVLEAETPEMMRALIGNAVRHHLANQRPLTLREWKEQLSRFDVVAKQRSESPTGWNWRRWLPWNR